MFTCVPTQRSEGPCATLTLGSLNSALDMNTATATLLDLVFTGTGTGTLSRAAPSRGHTLDGHAALLATTLSRGNTLDGHSALLTTAASSASQCATGGGGW